MNKLSISVVIHTFNEEKNIQNCIETVKWADEIIIVDMYSDDRTVEIAKKYTDKIFFFERLGYADPARQFSLTKATNKWVLSVDADELVPLKLKEQLVKIMDEDIADVVYIPHNNYFFGQLLQGGGWGALQNHHARFFKKEFVNFSAKIHNFFSIKKEARTHYLKNPEEGFIHLPYVDGEHFIEKLNKYTTIEAAIIFEKNKDIKLRNLISMIIKDEFIRRYIRLGGYKDGFRGLSLSLLMGAYRTATYLKLKIMKEYNSPKPREKILKKYQNMTEKVISEYKE